MRAMIAISALVALWVGACVCSAEDSMSEKDKQLLIGETHLPAGD
jgi:hypothetical protein